ncbi:reverse transcriptase domain-containing protein [Tanacetum coccineum]
MHVYWASVFILPSRVLLDFEHLMRNFLWAQGESQKGKSKVAWEVVCLPMKEGGLGVRRLERFNKALMVWDSMKVMAGLSNVMGSITVIVDTLIPMSKHRSARSVIAKLVVAACSLSVLVFKHGRWLMESRKMTGSIKNNDAAKIYVVDGKPLKSILKKPREPCRTDGNQQLGANQVAEKVVNNRNFPYLDRNRSKTDGKNKDAAGKPFQSVCVEEPATLWVYVAAVHNEDNEDAISNQVGNMDDMIGQEAGTFNSKSSSNVLSPNGAADVGGSEATDVDASVIPNGSPTMASTSYANPLNSEWINFCSLLNEEKVESYDYVLPQDVADVVKTSNFGLQKLMKTNEGIFMFKFASKEGLEKVLQRGLWMISNSSIILTKWSSTLSLKKGEVTSVPVWVKLHGVPILAYSGDVLSLIATQIGAINTYIGSLCRRVIIASGLKHLLVSITTMNVIITYGDAGLLWFMPLSFESLIRKLAMKLLEVNCVAYCCPKDFSGAVRFEVNSKFDLKTEVIMAIPNEKGDGYTKEVIRVEYEWKPPHCGDCKMFGRDLLHCPKHAAATVPNDPHKSVSEAAKSDGFTEVKRKKYKGKKADMQPRSRRIDGIRLNKPQPNFYWQKMGTVRSGADSDSTTKVSANSINKVECPSTSNSFDALNAMNVEDECGTSSYRGNQEQVEGIKVSKNEHVESDDEVDEFIFPEGDKFGDKFDIRLKGRVRK